MSAPDPERTSGEGDGTRAKREEARMPSVVVLLIGSTLLAAASLVLFTIRCHRLYSRLTKEGESPSFAMISVPGYLVAFARSASVNANGSLEPLIRPVVEAQRYTMASLAAFFDHDAGNG